MVLAEEAATRAKALGPKVFSSSRQARELGSEAMGRKVWRRS